MTILFLNSAGQTLFSRSDMESGHWVQEEMTVNADFPFVPDKVIERGQRIEFDGNVFEIRSVTTSEPDHYQQITAEHICISELQDEHIDKAEITDKTALQALQSVLTGTLWQAGTSTSTGTQSANISRGSVWEAVNTIKSNWNVYITPRVVFTDGAITGRYLDITPAQGNWNGVRLSVRKNFLDPVVTYNDEDVLTALYGYGAIKNENELTFKNVVWSETSDHPAKPSGQAYLEWPEKTALYGRNGRPRYGYYQNANIKDANILLQKTWETLQKTCDPKISISGSVADLYRLGYADQPLKLHDLAIVEIEETGERFYKEIIRLDVDLIDPSGSMVGVGDYIPNIVYINRDTAKKARGGGGGGGRGQTPNEAEESETFTQFEKNNEMIGMVVGTRNGGYYVKAGQIVLAINESGSSIKLEADTIDIDGIVTALETYSIHVDGLTIYGDTVSWGRMDVENVLWAEELVAYDSFTCLGSNVTWQEQEVVTGVSASQTAENNWMRCNTSGTYVGYTTSKLVTSVSKTTKTIHYLGM